MAPTMAMGLAAGLAVVLILLLAFMKVHTDSGGVFLSSAPIR
jgi:hypothetical protein